MLPDDVDAWAGAIDHVGRHRDDMVAAGRRRATHRTDEVSASALVTAYESAVA